MPEAQQEVTKNILQIRLSDLNEDGLLTTALINILEKAGIRTLEDLLEESAYHLLNGVRNIADDSVNQIRIFLHQKFNVSLKDETFEDVEQEVNNYIRKQELKDEKKQNEIRDRVRIRLKENHQLENITGIYCHMSSAVPLLQLRIYTIEDLSDFSESFIKQLINKDYFRVVKEAMDQLGIKFWDHKEG